MQETVQLAGFVAAHAIRCISEGKSLTMPLLVIEKDEGAQFIEVTAPSSEEAVRKAERLMKKPGPGARRGLVAVEAFLNLPTGQTDAILLHGRCYEPPSPALFMAVPFRPAGAAGGFAVFRPKFIAYEGEAVPPGALDAFWRGVALYPPGEAVWKAHQDDSR